MKDIQKHLRYWKIATFFLIVVASALTIGIIILAAHNNDDHSDSSTDKTGTEGEKGANKDDECSADYQVDHTINKNSIFHDLNEDEIIMVRDFMINDKSLNLTAHKDASLLDNFIFSIENYVPDKIDAVNYMESGSNKPMRRARVIVMHGADDPPSVKEYIVSPIPNPTKMTLLQLKPQQNFVPYHSRPIAGVEHMGFDMHISKIAKTVYRILHESFNGYVYHNCTDKCLQIFMQGFPGSLAKGARKTWFCAQYYVEGAILFPLPFEVMIDSADADVNKWTTKVRYNDQIFDTAEELLTAYDNGSIKKVKVPLPTDEEFLRATCRRRGDPFFNFKKHWPIPTDINGRRFSVHGNIIKYGKWHTEIAGRSTGAIGLFNTRFAGRRIAHEISIQEAIAYYSGYNPRSASSQYLDAGVGLGTSIHTLLPGTDCPENSVFLDVVVMFDSDTPTRVKGGICVFEWNAGIPQRRHYENAFKKGSSAPDGFLYYSGAVDNVLVIRTISTPYNYDYIVDFIFHQNGVIECKTSTAGYLQTSFYAEKEDEFGFPIFNTMFGPVHDHMILYKVDLDVNGTKNTFTTLDIKTKKVPYEFGEPGEYRFKKFIERNERGSEQDALIRYDFDKPKVYVFSNSDLSSRKDVPRGYRIYPAYMVKQVYPDDYIVTRRAAWSKYQLAVTKYDDLERFGSSMYNQHSGSDPVFDWDNMIKNNDSITDEDLVAWVSIGGLHVPVPEDIPTTFTTGNQYTFFIRPFGFFDEDPSMGSADTTFISSDGGRTVNTYDTPDTGKCSARAYSPK